MKDKVKGNWLDGLALYQLSLEGSPVKEGALIFVREERPKVTWMKAM